MRVNAHGARQVTFAVPVVIVVVSSDSAMVSVTGNWVFATRSEKSTHPSPAAGVKPSSSGSSNPKNTRVAAW